MNRSVVDVSALRTSAFGHHGLMWWGTIGIVVIESVAFGLLISAYIFLWSRNAVWPPGAAPPDLLWGTVNMAVLLASTVPNQLAKSAAERFDLAKVRLWLVVALAFALAFNVVRMFEFLSLNVWWDANAYGSIVWALLGVHTAHIVTDFIDSTVLTVYTFVGEMDETRFVDVSDNSMYWYFVVAAWIPVYATIYLAPRL